MTERLVTTIGGLWDEPFFSRDKPEFCPVDSGDLDVMMGIGDPADLPPVFVPTTGPAMAIPEPQTVAKSSAGTPPPAVVVKAAWFPDGRYVLQPGDTLWGLAATYLGNGARWGEIWSAQSADYRSSHSPDRIFAGEVIAMTPEAVARARALGLLGAPMSQKLGLTALVAAAGLFLWKRHH